MEILKADKPKVEELPDVETYNQRFREIVLEGEEP
jgi:hypothetical protein